MEGHNSQVEHKIKDMATQFSNEALKFLRGLKKNNDREWFGERKDVYEKQLKAPMLALIDEVNHAMLEFAPEHVRPPQKIMMRIYRDIRFSKDKRPYKNHVSAWWVRDGLQKTSGGGFYLQVSSTDVLVAAGVYMPEREQLLAYGDIWPIIMRSFGRLWRGRGCGR